MRRRDDVVTREPWPDHLLTFDPLQWDGQCDDVGCRGRVTCGHLLVQHEHYHWRRGRRHFADDHGYQLHEIPLETYSGYRTYCPECA